MANYFPPCTPISLATGKQRQEDLEFEASLNCIERPRVKWEGGESTQEPVSAEGRCSRP